MGSFVATVFFLLSIVAVWNGIVVLRRVQLLSSKVDGRYTADVKCAPLQSSSKRRYYSCEQAIDFRFPWENGDHTIRRSIPTNNFADGISYKPMSFETGTPVVLHYDPSDPKGSITVKRDRVYLVVVMISGGIQGVLFACAVCYFEVFRHRIRTYTYWKVKSVVREGICFFFYFMIAMSSKIKHIKNASFTATCDQLSGSSANVLTGCPITFTRRMEKKRERERWRE